MTGAIQAYVGSNGGGKTLAAIELSVTPAVEEGRVIVANCGLEVPNFKRLGSWRDIPRLGEHFENDGVPCLLGDRQERLEPRTLTEFEERLDAGYELWSLTANRPALLLLDEIASCMPSRSFSSMPTQLQRQLNQMRKPDVTVVWTAPNWARCDVILREVTQEVTVCRGYAGDRWVREPQRALWPKPLLDENGEKIPTNRKWRPHRLFKWHTYDAIEFENFTADDQHRIKPVAKRWYWRPAHNAQFVYRTRESVGLLDHLDDNSNCIGCGGKRTAPKCSCTFGDHDDHGPESRQAAGRGSRPPRPPVRVSP